MKEQPAITAEFELDDTGAVARLVVQPLHAAAARVRGKVAQPELIARDSAYVAALILAVPASSPPAGAARR